MLSDLALSIAVGSDVKWLHNSAARLRKHLGRTADDAVWWRLVHHLTSGVGVPLLSAAQAADLLLGQDSPGSRVRLRSTDDDTVAVTVDVGRFRDSSAIATAAALHLAIPRQRGRPPRVRPRDAIGASGSGESGSLAGTTVQRLESALAAIRSQESAGGSVVTTVQLAAALNEAGVPFVFVGQLAGVFHGLLLRAEAADLAIDPAPRFARSVAHVLNSLGARPRGVPVRPEFSFDAALVRAAPCLIVRVSGVAVNFVKAVPGIGEFAQVHDQSELVALESLSYRVLSRAAYINAVRARLP